MGESAPEPKAWEWGGQQVVWGDLSLRGSSGGSGMPAGNSEQLGALSRPVDPRPRNVF